MTPLYQSIPQKTAPTTVPTNESDMAGLPPVRGRPDRIFLPLWKIATYWTGRGVFWVEPDYPRCFGCGRDAEHDESLSDKERWNAASIFLERAHLADRVYGGLDQVQNIVAICAACHKAMPSFTDGRAAIKWVQAGGHPQVTGPKIEKLIAKFRTGEITLTQFGQRVAYQLRMPISAGIEAVTEAEEKYQLHLRRERARQKQKKTPATPVPMDPMF